MLSYKYRKNIKEEKMPKKRVSNIETEIKWSALENNCKTCIFRKKDLFDGKVNGGMFIMCSVYPNGKPKDVMYKGAECDYYMEGDPS